MKVDCIFFWQNLEPTTKRIFYVRVISRNKKFISISRSQFINFWHKIASSFIKKQQSVTKENERGDFLTSSKYSQIVGSLFWIGLKGPFFSENSMGLKKICQITTFSVYFLLFPYPNNFWLFQYSLSNRSNGSWNNYFSS